MAATFRLRIRGRVQGVGYRDWAMREARRLVLSGWVRNRSDGTVEALVSGEADAVETFIEAAHRGPYSARVTEVARTPDPPPAGPGFTCLPTL
jgi:acylphosphatase